MRTLGIDLGATKVEAITWEHKRCSLVWEEESSPQLATGLSKLISDLSERHHASAAGIGVAGLVKGNRVLFMPNLGVRDVEVSVGLPAFLINDANAFAYAEHELEFPGSRSLLGITIGTGIGAGLIIDGELYTGSGLACELGHVYVASDGARCGCGRLDHLEAYFSGKAIERDTGLPAEVVGRDRPDEVRTKLRYLARGVASAVHMLDPEVVVIGGSLGLSLDLDDLRQELEPLLLPGFCPMITESGMEHPVAVGAAIWAEKRFLANQRVQRNPDAV